tara:strand:- start:39833 stop:40582 length:750 start_codon:yes stop_codon:yes gene_type:complete
MKKNKTYTSKVYRLTNNLAPLSYMLASRHSSRFPLMHFDEEKGTNRPLRYARNQKSPFEDEQDGNAILEPIVFEDGMLTVHRNNQVLQEFLHYHPQNGGIFEEVNNEKDASDELFYVEAELEAQILAKNLNIDKLVTVSRALWGVAVERMTTPELKRDILLYAKSNPKDFEDLVNDPMLELENEIAQMFHSTILTQKGNAVHYNLKNNKKLMLTIPHNTERDFVVASYLQSDEGIAMYKILKTALNKAI